MKIQTPEKNSAIKMAYQTGVNWVADLRKSFRKPSSIRKSETEPAGLNRKSNQSNHEINSKSAGLDSSLDLDNDVFESQFSGFDGTRHFHKV